MTSLSPRALARIQQLTGQPVEFGPRVASATSGPKMGADTRAIIALAERIRRKLVHFAAVPARDPKTGAFTVGGAVTSGALRKVWRIPSRITPRPQSRTTRPTA